MDFSEMKGDDCNLEALLVGRNAIERTPGSDGAEVDRNGTGNGTWRLLTSNASMLPPSFD
jgi:hypothetical protein